MAASLSISGTNQSYTLTLSGMDTSTRYHVFVADIGTDGTINSYICRRSSLGASSSWTYSGSSTVAYGKNSRRVLWGTSTAATSHKVGSSYSYSEAITGVSNVKSVDIPAATVYTVTTSAGTGGTVSGNNGSYYKSSTCTLTATPNTGYSFSKWTINSTNYSTSNPINLVITSNTTVVANFSKTAEYTVTLSAGTGCASVSGADTYSAGATATISSTGNSGYVFKNWIDLSDYSVFSTANSTSFTVNQAWSLQAVWALEYILNGYYYLDGSNTWSGTLATNTNDHSYNNSSDVSSYITTHKPSGDVVYSNYEYSASGATTTARYYYTTNTYSVSLTKGTACASVYSSGGTTIKSGGSTTISATGDTGATWQYWYDNNSSSVFSYSQNVTISNITQDYDLTAVFKAGTKYKATAAVKDNVGGTVTGTDDYLYEATVTFTATASTGYEFKNWVDKNGAVVCNTSTYIFSMPNEAITYYAVFLPLYTYRAITGDDTRGYTDHTSSESVASGTTVTVTATPYSNYKFYEWVNNSDSTHLSYDNPYSFEISKNIVLKAIFKKSTEIEEFDWEKTISEGQPITNLTASDWTKLQGYIDTMVGTAFEWAKAETSDGKSEITAVIYNQLVDRLNNKLPDVLSGETKITLNEQSQKGTIKGIYFVDETTKQAIKDAINQAIRYYNAN